MWHIVAQRIRGRRIRGRLAVVAALALPGAALANEPDALTLRINDAAGRPGERVAVVVRTYAPRGVEQGQICLRARATLKRGSPPKAASPSPFAVLERVDVFSEAGDADGSTLFDGPAQSALVEFVSPSGSVNQSDGPIAVFFFRLLDTLSGGEEFDLEIDSAETFLIGAAGEPVPVEPRSGALRILGPGEPRGLAADGDSVDPGEIAELSIETDELFAIGGGQVVILYDPAFAASEPWVVMDPRHGAATFTADTSRAGRIVVSFQSPDASLNQVPGAIVSIFVETRSTLALGSRTAVAFDPADTWLWGERGETLELALESDFLEIGPEGYVFADGFESGDLSAW